MQPRKRYNQRWMIWLVVGEWLLAQSQVVWSWSNAINISGNTGSSYRPAIVVDSANTIHVVWSDNTINYPGNSEILYRKSSDGGATWSLAQNLSNSANSSLQPVIAAAGPSAIAVAWIDGGRISARIWNGTTWSPSTQLTTGTATTQQLSIAINQGGVALVAWNEGFFGDIYGADGPPPAGYLYRRWNGSVWSAPVPMAGRLVAMRGNLAYLATSQHTLLRSADAGATWASPIPLPAGYIVPDDMKIDSQNRLRMAWFGPTLNTVYAGMYNGQTFSDIAQVASGGYPNANKQLSLGINKNDQLTLVWTKNISLSDASYPGAMRREMQVLASQSADGQDWTAPASVVSGSGCFPAVAGAQTDARFYSAWQAPNCFSGESPDVYVALQNGIPQTGPTYSIAGRVLAYGGAPLADVTITAGAAGSAITDAQGNYTITGLAAKVYTLTAAKSGYRFTGLPAVAVPPSKTGQNFTGTLIGTGENTPLIFIPGIMGSVLRAKQDRSELWPAPFGTPGKQELKLPSDLEVVATYAIPSILNPLNDRPVSFYQPLLDRLHSAGYPERVINMTYTPLERCAGSGPTTMLYVFAYDWRKDIATSAEHLKQLVDCVRKEHQGTNVNILAHSMGGLVARRYILDNPPGQAAHHIGKLITIGTPWLGTPKALNTLVSGDAFDLQNYVALLMQPWQMKPLVETFPGSHELLPSKAFFDLGGQPYREDGVLGVGTKTYEYAEYERLLDTLSPQSQPYPPGTMNRKFHTEIPGEDDWRLDNSGVSYYHIYGVGKADDTIASLRYGVSISCMSAAPTPQTCVLLQGYTSEFGRGDQSVPLLSARRIATSDLNAPRTRTMLWAVMADRGNGTSDGDAEHLGMIKNPIVQDCILEALRPGQQSCTLDAAPRSAAQNATLAQSDPPVHAAYYLDVRGTGSVTVLDIFGNSTSTLSGTLGTQMPDVALYRLGDRAQQLVMPTDQTYTIFLQSEGTPLTIELTQGTGANKTRAIRYRDLVLPIHVNIMLMISPQGVDSLLYDANSNDIFETEIAPTISVSGPQAADLVPPAITIMKTGPLARTMVTLTAADSGSGVKAVRYSLDRTHYQAYTGPIQINALQTPVIYAFADDKVANRSSLVTYQFARRVYVPYTRR
jgi:pimeloyl-ACP methyl ester carboxylesterase